MDVIEDHNCLCFLVRVTWRCGIFCINASLLLQRDDVGIFSANEWKIVFRRCLFIVPRYFWMSSPSFPVKPSSLRKRWEIIRAVLRSSSCWWEVFIALVVTIGHFGLSIVTRLRFLVHIDRIFHLHIDYLLLHRGSCVRFPTIICLHRYVKCTGDPF